jgi:hypothetical protein
MTSETIQSTSTSIRQDIVWRNPDGSSIINEVRNTSWRSFESGWSMSFRTNLTALRDISVGSPGTNGRENAGYGGFFWRLPRCSNVTIMSSNSEGEDNVHGSISPWISWSAIFEENPEVCGEATIVVMAEDEVTEKDTWVVRLTAYPGIGSAVAWKERVEVKKGETLSRGFRLAIMDGIKSREEVSSIAQRLKRGT